MAGDSSSDDEGLARTATAPPSGSESTQPIAAVTPPQQELGRYRIERILGTGGMGIVYCAYDPDLERRVALKVLPDGARSLEARERLLREARAMARLNHPNVTSVFEVGSAGKHDYVAMELVDGTTLAEWLRAGKRSVRDVLGAFLGAGSGLAAAHAAGLMHRDFKPHNVLRHHDGHVEVTDFGLARDVASEIEEPAALPVRNTPTPLEGLTATGSIVGTPAYMAPEQWLGGEVGPAADQFAFCVALWEALAGARPYGGSLEEMREKIIRGPAALDFSVIPRALRDLLRRGLDPDPAKRWPSMAHVLGKLARIQRRNTVAIGLGVAIAATAGAIAVVLARGSAPSCRAPLLAPERAWPAGAVEALAAKHQLPAARAIDRDVTTWRATRDHVCLADAEPRVPQLACLDGVMARIDAAARLAESSPVVHTDIGGLLVDPAICDAPQPPTLVPVISAPYRAVMARADGEELDPEPLTRQVVDRMIAAAAGEPCAATSAHLYAINTDETLVARRAELAEAANLAEQCNDDRMRYAVAETTAEWEQREPTGDLKGAVKHLEAALARVAQPDLTADVDVLRATLAANANRIDDAIALGQRAMEGYRARGRIVRMLSASVQVGNLRMQRATKEDLAAVTRTFDDLSRIGMAALGDDDANVAKVDYLRGFWLYVNGDIAAAHAIYDRLRKPEPIAKPRRVSGVVVDEQGAPVADATVTSSCCLEGDSLGAAVANGQGAGKIRIAKTAADGSFVLPEAVAEGLIVAERGALRSRPIAIADQVKLVAERTGRIEGHVQLNGANAFNVAIRAADLGLPPTTSYQLVAPVLADGSFSIDGVPHGKVKVYASATRANASATDTRIVTVGDAPVRLELAIPSSTRTVHVLVRGTTSEAVPRAVIYLLPGTVASMTAHDLDAVATNAISLWANPIDGEHAPQTVLSRMRPGDLLATAAQAPIGEASACAYGLPSDSTNKQLAAKAAEHPEKIPIPCVPISATDEVVVVDVPPFPRFD